MLLLPGPEHRGCDYDEGIVVGGQRVRIVEEGSQGRGTAWCVWDGSIVLVRYLEADPGAIPKGLCRILELGAGTGLAGICTAVLFPEALVCMTDIDEALPALRTNVDMNGSHVGHRVSVDACDWTRPNESIVSERWDIVLATDVVWLEELVDPFIDTLDRITKKNPECRILMSYQSRTRRVDDMLFGGLAKKHFSVVPVPCVENEPPRQKIELFWVHT